MLGFKRFFNARRVLSGVELVQKIIKGIRLSNCTVIASPSLDMARAPGTTKAGRGESHTRFD